MSRLLVEIESNETLRGPIYLRFSNQTVERTESYSSGEVNVDLDHHHELIGIEMLSLGPNQIAALADIVRAHDLDLRPLFSMKRAS